MRVLKFGLSTRRLPSEKTTTAYIKLLVSWIIGITSIIPMILIVTNILTQLGASDRIPRSEFRSIAIFTTLSIVELSEYQPNCTYFGYYSVMTEILIMYKPWLTTTRYNAHLLYWPTTVAARRSVILFLAAWVTTSGLPITRNISPGNNGRRYGRYGTSLHYIKLLEEASISGTIFLGTIL